MNVSLVTLCEPIFQVVCRFNRMARKGSSSDYVTARSEVETILDRVATTARRDIALSEQYSKVELPLIFFLDSMISESALPFAAEWDRNRIANQRKEFAGDQKFFDLLDETIAETRDGVEERLAIFYTCLGLGLTGWYTGQPEYLRKKMLEISSRIKAHADFDQSGFITPESYQHTNTAKLAMPISSGLVPLIIILAGLFLVVGAVNLYTFKSSSAELNKVLDSIVARGADAAAKK